MSTILSIITSEIPINDTYKLKVYWESYNLSARQSLTQNTTIHFLLTMYMDMLVLAYRIQNWWKRFSKQLEVQCHCWHTQDLSLFTLFWNRCESIKTAVDVNTAHGVAFNLLVVLTNLQNDTKNDAPLEGYDHHMFIC